MSGTELATVDKKEFLALSPSEEMQEIIAENFGGDGFELSIGDLTRVKMPTGGLIKWIIPELGGEEVADEIVGVLCAITKGGVIWSAHEPDGSGNAPLLRSTDLITARNTHGVDVPKALVKKLKACEIGKDPDGTVVYCWQKLAVDKGSPFGWDTGKGGFGKWAKEQRNLFILRKNEMMPLLITATPGSLRALKKFLTDLSMQKQLIHYRAIVSLKLEKTMSGTGSEYARIVPELVGKLSAEDGLAVREQYTKPLKQIEIPFAGEVDEVEASDEGDDEQTF